MKKKHERFMKKALNIAENALNKNEFPVGAVIEYQGEIVAEGERRFSNVSELEHAEIIALKKLNNLKEIDPLQCTIYINLEPCLMCFGAILINKIKKIVYAYEDIMGGGTFVNVSRKNTPILYKDIEVTKGVLRSESIKLFKTFFSNSKNSYLKETHLSKYTLKL